MQIAQFYNVNESIVRNILNESKEKVDSIKSDKNSIFNNYLIVLIQHNQK